jgi:YHYH protein
MKTFAQFAALMVIGWLFYACQQNTDIAPTNTGTTTPTTSATTPSTGTTTPGTSTTTPSTSTNDYGQIMLKAFQDYGASNVTARIDGDYLVVTTTTVPDHKSPYFATSDSRYEANNSTTFRKAPNSIVAGSITFRIPTKPVKATSAQATAGGAIGVALNGVPFFNQYAAMNAPLTNEIQGFDQYGGHPQQQGQYHYHVEPLYITAKKGKSALLGFLLDGFPVYGPVIGNKTIVSKDLDSYHGRTGTTTEYPNGIYHYVVTADDPYINGSGYYGTPGTVTR